MMVGRGPPAGGAGIDDGLEGDSSGADAGSASSHLADACDGEADRGEDVSGASDAGPACAAAGMLLSGSARVCGGAADAAIGASRVTTIKMLRTCRSRVVILHSLSL